MGYCHPIIIWISLDIPWNEYLNPYKLGDYTKRISTYKACNYLFYSI